MARTQATEPAVYDQTTTTRERNRNGAVAAAAFGALVLLALILWFVWGMATT